MNIDKLKHKILKEIYNYRELHSEEKVHVPLVYISIKHKFSSIPESRIKDVLILLVHSGDIHLISGGYIISTHGVEVYEKKIYLKGQKHSFTIKWWIGTILAIIGLGIVIYATFFKPPVIIRNGKTPLHLENTKQLRVVIKPYVRPNPFIE